jgi:hypothetical protein
VGLGAAACAACCAGPIVAFLGGLGVAGLLSAAVIGGVGLLVTAAAVGAMAVRRRRRPSCAVPQEVVPVGAPTRRASQTREVP